MVCTGCRILFTFPNTITNAASHGGKIANRAGSAVGFYWRETVDGGDGKCVDDEEEGCIADDENPCVFKGLVSVESPMIPADPATRYDVIASTCGGTQFVESIHRFETSRKHPNWKWEFDIDIPIGRIQNPNTSACEGLVNPIDDASNAYKIVLYKEDPKTPNTRDDSGKPTEPSLKEGIAYLYCEPCEEFAVAMARLQNPVMVSADLISSQDPI